MSDFVLETAEYYQARVWPLLPSSSGSHGGHSIDFLVSARSCGPMESIDFLVPLAAILLDLYIF